MFLNRQDTGISCTRTIHKSNSFESELIQVMVVGIVHGTVHVVQNEHVMCSKPRLQ